MDRAWAIIFESSELAPCFRFPVQPCRHIAHDIDGRNGEGLEYLLRPAQTHRRALGGVLQLLARYAEGKFDKGQISQFEMAHGR